MSKELTPIAQLWQDAKGGRKLPIGDRRRVVAWLLTTMHPAPTYVSLAADLQTSEGSIRRDVKWLEAQAVKAAAAEAERLSHKGQSSKPIPRTPLPDALHGLQQPSRPLPRLNERVLFEHIQWLVSEVGADLIKLSNPLNGAQRSVDAETWAMSDPPLDSGRHGLSFAGQAGVKTHKQAVAAARASDRQYAKRQHKAAERAEPIVVRRFPLGSNVRGVE